MKDNDNGEDDDMDDGDKEDEASDGDEKVEDSEEDDSDEDPAPKVSKAKANRRGQAPTAQQSSSSSDLGSRTTRQKNLRLVIDKLKGKGHKGG